MFHITLDVKLTMYSFPILDNLIPIECLRSVQSTRCAMLYNINSAVLSGTDWSTNLNVTPMANLNFWEN